MIVLGDSLFLCTMRSVEEKHSARQIRISCRRFGTCRHVLNCAIWDVPALPPSKNKQYKSQTSFTARGNNFAPRMGPLCHTSGVVQNYLEGHVGSVVASKLTKPFDYHVCVHMEDRVCVVPFPLSHARVSSQKAAIEKERASLSTDSISCLLWVRAHNWVHRSP